MERYDSYKNSGVEWLGDIPSHWTKSKLKFVSEIVTGNTPPTKDEDNYEGGEYLWVKPNEINGLTPTNDTNQKLTEKGKSLSRVLPPFSVLVNGIGRIGEFGYSELSVSTNQQINSIVYNHKVDKRYGLFHTSMMKEGFVSNSEKVVVPILNKTKQENIEFIIPPLSEQQQIVSFLDTKTSLIDSLIEKTQRKIELLKEKRTSLINEVVTKGLNPDVEMKDSGVEWIGEIPSHWVKTNVRMLIGKGFLEIQDGNHGEIHPKSEDYIDDGIPFVMSNNLRDGIVDYESCKKLDKNLTDKLRIGFSKTGDVLLTHKGTVGRVSIVSDMDYPYIMLTPQVTYYRCLDNSVSNRHLYYQFQSDFFQKEMDLLSSDGSTRKFIGIVDQRNLPILIIPINEQQQIVEYLDEQTQLIDNTISIEEKRIELLKEYRQSLISEVVTGKRKVVE